MQASSPSNPLLSASWCTVHPFTESDQVAMAQMRTLVEPNKGKLRGIDARPIFDDIIRRVASIEQKEIVWDVGALSLRRGRGVSFRCARRLDSSVGVFEMGLPPVWSSACLSPCCY
jgi:hypothetical protein